MIDMIASAAYFGTALTLCAYFIGTALRKRFRSALLNPILIGLVITVAVLSVLKIDYGTYYSGAKYISYLLTPATICLAIPLYEQFEVLKKNALAITAGILSGVITSLFSVLLLAILFGFTHEEYVTFLPKSITTAIGMGVSEELGGMVSITIIVIILTGMTGNILADLICRLFRITEPVAKGLGIGTASHAIGTARAMEIGEVEGAISSLSIVVTGFLTVIGANLFAVLF